MSALERARQCVADLSHVGPRARTLWHSTEGGNFTSDDLAKVIAAVEAAKALHASAHNGHVYEREYAALAAALTDLEK